MFLGSIKKENDDKKNINHQKIVQKLIYLNS